MRVEAEGLAHGASDGVLVGGGTPRPAPDVGRSASPPLRRYLIIVDLLVVAAGWSVALLVASLVRANAGGGTTSAVVESLVILAAGALLLTANGLYRRQICAVRSQEIARSLRVSAALGFLTWLLLFSGGANRAAMAGLVGALTWSVLLVAERGLFREWIQSRRAGGDFSAAVTVIGGTEASTERLASFLREHPVLGFDVRGTVGPWHLPTGAERSELDWYEDPELLVENVLRLGATGAVLDAASLTGDQLNALVREFSGRNLHAHVSSGLRGVDRRRITVAPLADETFLHVSPLTLSRRQVITKRVLDVALGWGALVLALPLLVPSVAAIWLTDRQPVLFRQRRVGLNGEEFTLYKLRTMTVGADQQLEALAADNDRNGPLFKLASDPRVTRVGRFLRATSIDELPQLLNVIEGTMSLVGPRPALPAEVAQFDPRLQARLTVKPGLTGLWQVEARDLASFELYRRYDLLYIENWSLPGDIAIIARTVTVVLSRAARALVPAGLRSGRRASVLE